MIVNMMKAMTPAIGWEYFKTHRRELAGVPDCSTAANALERITPSFSPKSIVVITSNTLAWNDQFKARTDLWKVGAAGSSQCDVETCDLLEEVTAGDW